MEKIFMKNLNNGCQKFETEVDFESTTINELVNELVRNGFLAAQFGDTRIVATEEGKRIPENEMNKTLAELNIKPESTLSFSMKFDGAFTIKPMDEQAQIAGSLATTKNMIQRGDQIDLRVGSLLMNKLPVIDKILHPEEYKTASEFRKEMIKLSANTQMMIKQINDKFKLDMLTESVNRILVLYKSQGQLDIAHAIFNSYANLQKEVNNQADQYIQQLNDTYAQRSKSLTVPSIREMYRKHIEESTMQLLEVCAKIVQDFISTLTQKIEVPPAYFA